MLERLRDISWPTPPHLPGFSGAEAFAGARPPCRFICTVDHDGQIELSLSLPGPKRPSKAQAVDFLRWLGVEPVESANGRVTRHFVLRRGTVN